MSHTAVTKTTISRVHKQLLNETLTLIQKANPGLEIDTYYKDYSGVKHAVPASVRHPQRLPRGLGLQFSDTTEGLEFVGDSWGHTDEYTRLQELILSTYQTLAVKQVLTQKSYKIQSLQQTGQRFRLEAVHA